MNRCKKKSLHARMKMLRRAVGPNSVSPLLLLLMLHTAALAVGVILNVGLGTAGAHNGFAAGVSRGEAATDGLTKSAAVGSVRDNSGTRIRDKSGTTGSSENEHAPQLAEYQQFAEHGSFQTERVGLSTHPTFFNSSWR